ncbi:DUF4191 domain-containing protein [Devriesea agamarum]|uniref:DUF4191 domain-containing protein n=1 Tax=Devriesea agamarum TaxID=472569 RepID=UPI00071D2312|nr:DUF4191 domain-containing protein [Devriesea agamarum]
MAAKKTDKTSSSADQKKPKKKGRLKQIVEVLRFTQKADRSTVPIMIAVLLGAIIIGVIIGLIINHPYYVGFVGLLFGILGAMFVLARKAEAAAYAQIKGQKGAALAAMQSIRRGWNIEDEPCQIDPRSQDMIFRASGRAGIALVGEGSSNRVKRLMDKEETRLSRLLPNVPIHRITMGDGDGEIPLHKIASRLQRKRGVLTKQEAAEVARRLHAMPGPIRQAIPKGVDPMRVRPNRKALRGR